MLSQNMAAQVKGCEVPGCEDGPLRLVAMDDLLREPDAKALTLCPRHFEKWEQALKFPAEPYFEVELEVRCQQCRGPVRLTTPEELADWMSNQYGMGPVVGWLCPRCREQAA